MMINKIKKLIKKTPLYILIISIYSSIFSNSIIVANAKNNNINVKFYKSSIDFQSQNKIIRINNKHIVYSMDIVNSFDYYYNSVVSVDDFNGNFLVDFSTPKFHEVVGFTSQPIIFPSLAEPLVTTIQYLDFADLQMDSVVIDLGAYSGLTSILFKQKCGNGEVIAVDADERNLMCISKNLKLFNTISGLEIKLLNGAVWNHNEGLFFSNEGNMGSSAVSIIGERIVDSKKFVNSYKLIDIVNKFGLKKVDFIKCDVEGAEAVIFNDDEFFNKFKPRIIVEPHFVDGQITTSKVEDTLRNYGYKFNLIEQHGVALPLLHCYQ
jgi:FkbM family methyltransferase